MSVRGDLLDQAESVSAMASNAIGREEPDLAVAYELHALRLTIAAALPQENGDREPFEQWADVELMGHRRRIALVREVEIGHRTFLELTSFPEVNRCSVCGLYHRGRDGRHGCEEFVEPTEKQVEIYSPSAVFCMTPLASEEAAYELARGGVDEEVGAF